MGPRGARARGVVGGGVWGGGGWWGGLGLGCVGVGGSLRKKTRPPLMLGGKKKGHLWLG